MLNFKSGISLHISKTRPSKESMEYELKGVEGSYCGASRLVEGDSMGKKLS
jgi:hypothetical protein